MHFFFLIFALDISSLLTADLLFAYIYRNIKAGALPRLCGFLVG